jgi:hypothetical protein
MLRQVLDAMLPSSISSSSSSSRCAVCADERKDLARLEVRMCRLERAVYARPHDSVQCVEQMLRVVERAIGE